MDVIVTGPYGRVGTALIDHLHDRDEYDFTYFNRSEPDGPWSGHDTVVADIQEYDALLEATQGHDAMIHLAAYPYVDSDWTDIHGPNITGMFNALEACRQAGVGTFVFGSTNHVLGQYETEFAPEIYYPGHGMALDRDSPVRPDSFYGTSKVFGEALGRQYVENYDAPTQFYSLRICSVRYPEWDHPYGDAERAVANGEIERGSPEYEQRVARMKAMWQSRRDLSHQVECCLQDDSVAFDIFSGVSDNDRRWYSIEHARSVLGYSPNDNGEAWDEPPAWSGNRAAVPDRSL